MNWSSKNPWVELGCSSEMQLATEKPLGTWSFPDDVSPPSPRPSLKEESCCPERPETNHTCCSASTTCLPASEKHLRVGSARTFLLIRELPSKRGNLYSLTGCLTLKKPLHTDYGPTNYVQLWNIQTARCNI